MLRFTLHRPSQDSRVSTCCHGMSCRDVSCRVHVGVRPVTASHAHEDRLALAPLGCNMPAGVAGLRRVRSLTFSTRVGAFCSNRVTSRPQADFRMLRLRPAAWTTFLPAPVAGESALQPQEPRGFLGAQPSRTGRITGGQSRRDRDTPIHTNDLTGAGGGDRVGDQRERVKIPQGLLLDCLRPSGKPRLRPPGFGQLCSLRFEAQRWSFPPRPHRVLLQAEVPHVPGVSDRPAQQKHLLRGTRMLVGHHTANLATTSDKTTMLACSCRTRPRRHSCTRSTPATVFRPGACGRILLAGSTGLRCATGPGPRHTPPDHAVARLRPPSRTTSPTRDGPTGRGFLPALKDRVSAPDHR